MNKIKYLSTPMRKENWFHKGLSRCEKDIYIGVDNGLTDKTVICIDEFKELEETGKFDDLKISKKPEDKVYSVSPSKKEEEVVELEDTTDYRVMERFLKGDEIETRQLLRSICKFCFRHSEYLDEMEEEISELEERVKNVVLRLEDIEGYVLTEDDY